MKLIFYVQHTLLAATLFCGANVFAAPAGNLPLMPWPQKVVVSEGQFVVDRNINIVVSGDNLDSAINRWRQRIEAQTGWILPPEASLRSAATIRVIIAKKVNAIPLLNVDESYQLVITNQGVELNATTRFGALRGMETVLQLLQNGPKDTYFPLIKINDNPRFPWRGVLLDSSRHFLPLSSIKRQLDGMSAAKMNVLHWHLTDDQGWRFASATYPKLQQLASDGLFYTPAQMKEVVQYAAELGIRVVPEIDLPGHASAIAVAYPELMSVVGLYQMERDWGVHKATLDPSNPEVYKFVDAIIGEVAAIFPDPYLHIGGDEVDASQWQSAKSIKIFMQQNKLADVHQLHTYFNQQLEQILTKYHRQMVGWDEIYHPSLARSVVIQSWQGPDSLGEIAQNGYQGILSTGFYLDQPQSTAYHYRNQIQPQPLAVDDKVAKDETAQSWDFTMPRLKGNPVKGSFTLIAGQKGWRGFIDFAGKSRRAVTEIKWLAKDSVRFSVDSWMGETSPVVSIKDNKLSGYILVGNVRYPVTGSRLDKVPDGVSPSVPTVKNRDNILGGEAALWSENVTAEILDLKLWPRTFAVAERLWSAEDVNEEQNMYRRLDSMDVWSTVSVGLEQHAESIRLMMRLANGIDIEPLQILSEAVEPAQYYSRHHAKFQRDSYNQFEALNRFADALPAESRVVRQMDELISRLIANKQDQVAADALRRRLLRWKNNNQALIKIVADNSVMSDLKPVAVDVGQIAEIGLKLIESWTEGKPLTIEQSANAYLLLTRGAEMRDEVVIRAVYPLERLLQALNTRQQSVK